MSECPYCGDEIERDSRRWRGRPHHPGCADQVAQREGEVWSSGHPLARTLDAIVADLDLEFSEPWCVCLEEPLFGWHEIWPVDYTDEPYHYCPACRILNPATNGRLRGPCETHPAPKRAKP